jgi:hypothetical protein
MHRQSNSNFWQNEPKFSEASSIRLRARLGVSDEFAVPLRRGGIIVRCIAHATSVRGGGRLASTRSRLLAASGKRRTEWA